MSGWSDEEWDEDSHRESDLGSEPAPPSDGENSMQDPEGDSASALSDSDAEEPVGPQLWSCMRAMDMQAPGSGRIMDERMAVPPDFSLVRVSPTGWSTVRELGTANALNKWRPAYAMCVNVPLQFYENNATAYTDVRAPIASEAHRCAGFAKLMGLLFVPLSKGYRSGEHEEDKRKSSEEEKRRNHDEGDKGGGDDDGSKRKQPVNKYAYWHGTASDARVAPMRTYGHELLKSPNGDVVGIRIWIFVSHGAHDISHLTHVLMTENAALYKSGHLTGTSAASRSSQLAMEHERAQKRIGGDKCDPAHLPDNAGLQYQKIHNCTHLAHLYQCLATSGGVERHFYSPEDISAAACHTDLNVGGSATTTGSATGYHVLSPRYVLNARRPRALAAGLVWDGKLIDVCAEQLDVATYFHESGAFCAGQEILQDNLYFNTDIYCKSLWDVVMPVPARGALKIPPVLLKMYTHVEQNSEDGRRRAARGSARDRFFETMTNTDAHDQVRKHDARATVSGWDCISGGVQANSLVGVASDGTSCVLRAREPLKEIAAETERVRDRVLVPYQSMMQARCSSSATRLQELREEMAKAMNALFVMHTERTMDLFCSTGTSKHLPAGYVAIVKQFNDLLDESPSRSASIAFHGEGFDLTYNDKTPWAQWREYVRTEIYQTMLQGNGRDWSDAMETIHLHTFEVFTEGARTIQFLSGRAGSGKTTLVNRYALIAPEKSFCQAGSSSTLAGKNGDNVASNGKVMVWGEMNKRWLDGTGVDDMKRLCDPGGEQHHQRTMRDADNVWRTTQIETVHNCAYICCSNNGPRVCATETTSESTRALVTRSQTLQVRSVQKDSDDAEVRKALLLPQNKLRITRFRLFDCLSKIVVMLITKTPSFMPDFDHAKRIFDYLDQQMLESEYNMPAKAPRRKQKRLVDLLTLCVEHAVVNVYGFKSTAVDYECGTPDAAGTSPRFEWAHLWEIVREAQAPPSLEVVLQVWAHGLDHDPHTSNHVLNATLSVCDAFGMGADRFLTRPANVPIDDLLPNAQPVVADDIPTLDLQVMAGCGAVSHPEAMEWTQRLERRRRAQAAVLRQAHDSASTSRTPDLYQCIDELMKNAPLPWDFEGLGDPDAERAAREGQSRASEQDLDAVHMPLFSSVLAPTVGQVIYSISKQALPQWLSGRVLEGQLNFDRDMASIGASTWTNSRGATGLRFHNRSKEKKGPGSSNVFDAASWDTSTLSLPLTDVRALAEGSNTWRRASSAVASSSPTARKYSLDNASEDFMRDSLMLCSPADPESKRLIAREPFRPTHQDWSTPFVDSDGKTAATSNSTAVGMKPTASGKRFYTHADEVTRGMQPAVYGGLDGQLLRHPYAKVHPSPIDDAVTLAVRNRRLPTASPHLTTNVERTAPLTTTREPGGNTYYLNASHSFLIERAAMDAEAKMRLALVDGCGCSVPNAGDDPSGAPRNLSTTALPCSADLQQMAFVVEGAGYLYDTGSQPYKERLCSDARNAGAMVEDATSWPFTKLQLRYSSLHKKDSERRLLTIPMPEAPNVRKPHVEAAGELRGVQGDIFDNNTLCVHGLTSRLQRGFISGPDDPAVERLYDLGRGYRATVRNRAISRALNGAVERYLASKQLEDTPATRAPLYASAEVVGEALADEWHCGFASHGTLCASNTTSANVASSQSTGASAEARRDADAFSAHAMARHASKRPRARGL